MDHSETAGGGHSRSPARRTHPPWSPESAVHSPSPQGAPPAGPVRWRQGHPQSSSLVSPAEWDGFPGQPLLPLLLRPWARGLPLPLCRGPRETRNRDQVSCTHVGRGLAQGSASCPRGIPPAPKGEQKMGGQHCAGRCPPLHPTGTPLPWVQPPAQGRFRVVPLSTSTHGWPESSRASSSADALLSKPTRLLTWSVSCARPGGRAPPCTGLWGWPGSAWGWGAGQEPQAGD